MNADISREHPSTDTTMPASSDATSSSDGPPLKDTTDDVPKRESDYFGPEDVYELDIEDGIDDGDDHDGDGDDNEGSSSSAALFGTSNGTKAGHHDDPAAGGRIAPSREDRAVFWAEALAVALVAFATVAFAVATAALASTASPSEDQELFHAAFAANAAHTQAATQRRWTGQEEAMSAFAASLAFATADGEGNGNGNGNETWPNVTVPPGLFFGVGSPLLVPRYVDSYLIAPVLPLLRDGRTGGDNGRFAAAAAGWDSYSRDNSASWIEAGRAYETGGGGAHQRRHRRRRLADSDANADAYYAPVWQHYPVRPGWVGHDLASDPSIGGAGLVNATVFLGDRRTALMGRTTLLLPLPVGGGGSDGSDGGGVLLLGESYTNDGPVLPTVVPIVVGSHHHRPDDEDEQEPTAQVVGLLVGLTRWSQVFSAGAKRGPPSSSSSTSSSSPAAAAGMIAVVENACADHVRDNQGGAFSFAVALPGRDDNDATYYLGPGDLHDPRYDPMRRTYILSKDETEAEGGGEGATLTDAACAAGRGGYLYRISLYPTAELQQALSLLDGTEEDDGRWLPSWAAAAIIAGAVGTVLLLAVLHSSWRGRRRHRAISLEAAGARRVVASLFPSSVHDRLFQRTTVGVGVNDGGGRGGATTAGAGAVAAKDRTTKPAGQTAASSRSLGSSCGCGLDEGCDDPRGGGGGGDDHPPMSQLADLSPSRTGRSPSERTLGRPSPPAVLAVDAVPSALAPVGDSRGGSNSMARMTRSGHSVGGGRYGRTRPNGGRGHRTKSQSQRSVGSLASTADADDDDDDENDEDFAVPHNKWSSSRSLRLESPLQRLRAFLSDPSPTGRPDHSPPMSGRSLHGQTSCHGGTTGGGSSGGDEPIADLFPECTVMFADISGFTAWSSVREPAQVFKLLETIYGGFDRLAKKLGVFKVETIGDCYVAVTGLPDPQPDHAIIMSKFAKESMQKMAELVRLLEVSLGPDTADLCMRYGLHSGPVTAGVLRGEKSRFQLFGDTVNFASRMESTGQRHKIQCSQATADLLAAGGRKHWVHPRDDVVYAKGKGEVQTHWIVPRSSSDKVTSGSLHKPKEPRKTGSVVYLKSKRKGGTSSHHSSSPKRVTSEHTHNGSRGILIASSQHDSEIWSSGMHDTFHGMTDEDYDGFEDTNRQERLIEWNVEILANLLRRIVTHRKAKETPLADSSYEFRLEYKENQTALDELTEIIPIGGPAELETSQETISMDASKCLDIGPDTAVLPLEVEEQLRGYVNMVACMYRDNAFHCFEHASHVLNSVQKLLKRVVLADRERDDSSQGHLYTSRIASDPLTQFAIVFSALIHDVDHTGVSNGQLINDNAAIANLYKNKSVAEQNSCDLAWELLMDPVYRDLHRCIFGNETEFKRFRQLTVNVVLATDIFDQGMKDLRNSRWEKAFQQGKDTPALSQDDEFNLKGTIVLEYIMQASDVSHTMQHWHVYKKWNERLFEETYTAFLSGRGDNDPSIGWYNGELWFFDNYVIPLAGKLKECRVFGAASDECLNYATSNRSEWERKGEEIVKTYVAKVKGGLRM